jgi:hypothetical protein
MATDYDAPRNKEDDQGQDSLEALKTQQRSGAMTALIDVEDSDTAEHRPPRRGPLRRGAGRPDHPAAGGRVHLHVLLPGPPQLPGCPGKERRKVLPRLRRLDNRGPGRRLDHVSSGRFKTRTCWVGPLTMSHVNTRPVPPVETWRRLGGAVGERCLGQGQHRLCRLPVLPAPPGVRSAGYCRRPCRIRTSSPLKGPDPAPAEACPLTSARFPQASPLSRRPVPSASLRLENLRMRPNPVAEPQL